jgi:hypothetical protein
MLLIAGILFALWLLGVLAFKVTKGLMLIVAIIVLVMNFIRG